MTPRMTPRRRGKPFPPVTRAPLRGRGQRLRQTRKLWRGDRFSLTQTEDHGRATTILVAEQHGPDSGEPAGRDRELCVPGDHGPRAVAGGIRLPQHHPGTGGDVDRCADGCEPGGDPSPGTAPSQRPAGGDCPAQGRQQFVPGLPDDRLLAGCVVGHQTGHGFFPRAPQHAHAGCPGLYPGQHVERAGDFLVRRLEPVQPAGGVNPGQCHGPPAGRWRRQPGLADRRARGGRLDRRRPGARCRGNLEPWRHAPAQP